MAVSTIKQTTNIKKSGSFQAKLNSGYTKLVDNGVPTSAVTWGTCPTDNKTVFTIIQNSVSNAHITTFMFDTSENSLIANTTYSSNTNSVTVKWFTFM